VYCDFKPDNVIQTEEQLKLIDMGGVRPIDGDGAIYGTAGYQAPEIADDGPSPESDLYTVGRALAVMTFDFKGFQGEYKYRLPDGVPLLEQHESYRRLLLRATNPDPGRRFGSASEMVDQLTGVLREVLAAGDGRARPSYSRVFSPELRAVGTDGAMTVPPAHDVIAALPVPQVDGTDPAAGLLATLAGMEPAQREAALSAAASGRGGVQVPVAESAETQLALARARIDLGDLDGAAAVLQKLAATDPADWRLAWCSGLREVAVGRAAVAAGAFSAVYDELPGEIAPKLALALAAEAAGDLGRADHYYRLAWTADRSYVSAAFGLTRTRLAAGDRRGAIDTLLSVPNTSSYYVAAQTAAVRTLVAAQATSRDGLPVGSPPAGGATERDLREAADIVSRLKDLDEVSRQRLTVEILQAALTLTAPNGHGGHGAHSALAGGQGRAPVPVLQGGPPLLGCEMSERSLRFGLESGYRSLARLTSDSKSRIDLVDMANHVRPRTWT
jgi:serine/threonine-protein kinase PknG